MRYTAWPRRRCGSASTVWRTGGVAAHGPDLSRESYRTCRPPDHHQLVVTRPHIASFVISRTAQPVLLLSLSAHSLSLRSITIALYDMKQSMALIYRAGSAVLWLRCPSNHRTLLCHAVRLPTCPHPRIPGFSNGLRCPPRSRMVFHGRSIPGISAVTFASCF